jgi:hypothetical protein
MSRDRCPVSPLARSWTYRNTSRDRYTLLCDDTAYAEVCLPSRCLETGCITPMFHCCVLDRVYGAVAWQSIDQFRYNIIITVQKYIVEFTWKRGLSGDWSNNRRSCTGDFIVYTHIKWTITAAGCLSKILWTVWVSCRQGWWDGIGDLMA